MRLKLTEALKRRIKSGLTDWATYALHPLKQEPAAHHRFLISKLEAVARGEIKRLIVTMPPGSAKSTFVSVLFPAWYMLNFPNKNILAASHTASLADSFSKRVQSIIKDNQDILGYGLLNESVEMWSTSNGCTYKSAGVGAGIAGFRADCIVAGTMVTTPLGEVPIEDILPGTKTGYVLSYDKRTNKTVFKRVVAVARRKSSDIWRIRSTAGNMVESTGNHRFKIAGGWSPASSLSVADVLLLALPSAGRKAYWGSQEVSRPTTLLQQDMLNPHNECGAGHDGSDMRSMRQIPGRDAAHTLNLFGGLPSRWGAQGCGLETEAAFAASLPDMWGDVYAEGEGRNGSPLQRRLQECQPFGIDEGASKSRLAAWQGDGSWDDAAMVCCETEDLGPRWIEMRGMQFGQKPECASYQYESNGSQIRKSSNTLSLMPYEVSCDGTFNPVCDSVAMVERVCGEKDVYDLQIEDTECFFANGILVHNCAIIDDPTKSRADAESPTYREKTYNWYRADLRTRLKPGASVCLVLTRWHGDDLAGRLLQDDPDGWEVIKIPAIAEENDQLGRKPGEVLWADDSYGYAAEVLKIKAESEKGHGQRDWFSLYQQSPRPLEGSIFKTGMIEIVDAIPAGCTFCRAWDLASTSETGGRDPDWTAGPLLGRTPSGGYIIADLQRERGGPDDVEKLLKATASQDGKGVTIRLPQDPGQAGKVQVQYLSRKLAGYKISISRPTGDKATRAAPFASQVNAGNVSMLRADWNRFLLEELGTFPGGAHDDIVDGLSDAFEIVQTKTSAIERAKALTQ